MVSHSRQDIHARPLFEPSIVRRAVSDSFWKLNPIHQLRNPVMFTVWICSAFTTGLWAQALAGHGEGRLPPGRVVAADLRLAHAEDFLLIPAGIFFLGRLLIRSVGRDASP